MVDFDKKISQANPLIRKVREECCQRMEQEGRDLIDRFAGKESSEVLAVLTKVLLAITTRTMDPSEDLTLLQIKLRQLSNTASQAAQQQAVTKFLDETKTDESSG